MKYKIMKKLFLPFTIIFFLMACSNDEEMLVVAKQNGVKLGNGTTAYLIRLDFKSYYNDYRIQNTVWDFTWAYDENMNIQRFVYWQNDTVVMKGNVGQGPQTTYWRELNSQGLITKESVQVRRNNDLLSDYEYIYTYTYNNDCEMTKATRIHKYDSKSFETTFTFNWEKGNVVSVLCQVDSRLIDISKFSYSDKMNKYNQPIPSCYLSGEVSEFFYTGLYGKSFNMLPEKKETFDGLGNKTATETYAYETTSEGLIKQLKVFLDSGQIRERNVIFTYIIK